MPTVTTRGQQTSESRTSYQLDHDHRQIKLLCKLKTSSQADWRWFCRTHKKLEELEDPLVCENIKCIPRDRVDDRQAVNFVFDEGVHCIKQAATQQTQWPVYMKHTEICSHTHTQCKMCKNRKIHYLESDSAPCIRRYVDQRFECSLKVNYSYIPIIKKYEDENENYKANIYGYWKNKGEKWQLMSGMSICDRKIKIIKIERKPYVPCFVQQTHMLGWFG